MTATTIVRAVGWAGLALTAFEAIARQITRTRPIPALPEAPLALAGVAAISGILLIVASRPPRAADGGSSGRSGHRMASVFATLLAVGLAFQLHLGARLQSDGFYYYAYLRSLAFDRDVNFLNDYRMLGLSDKPYLFEPTSTGHAHSAWTIGPAIVWSPFFAAGHLAASRLNAAGGGALIAVDGTSYPYRQAVCIAGLFYTLAGAWFTLGFARRFFDGSTAAIATAMTIGGSFMVWYAIAEPSMTHAPSMAVVAGFAWYWAATMGRRDLRRWAILGAIAGFAGLIRWQNVIFALLPAIEMVLGRPKPASRRLLACGAVFAAAATVAFAPQMLAWKAIYGSYLAVSPVGPTIDPLQPHLVDVLFSSRNGLLAMSPVLYVAAIGAIGFAWRRPAAGVPILAAFAAMTWFNASIYDWWGSDGFGGRRFDGLVPLLVPGTAVALEALRRAIARRPQAVVGALFAALVLWNLTLMSAAQRGVMRLGEPVMFRRVAADQARTLHGWFGHPFSYPVNLWYAARNAVPPGAYDLLAPYRFLGDRARPYGQIDVGGGDEMYAGDGWHAPERDGDRTFRWASRDAALLVPLDRAAPLDVVVRLRAVGLPGAPPQQVTLVLGGRDVATADVPADWNTVTFETPAAAWRAGVTRMTLRFAWAIRPVDVGASGDTRPLAAAVDNVLVRLREDGR
jgi:hypothetical protein